MGDVVEFHSELLGKGMDRKKTIGGGRWDWDEKGKKVYFYGSSTDFGSVTKEQFSESWENSFISPFMEECEIYWSEKEYQSDAMKAGWERLFLKTNK